MSATDSLQFFEEYGLVILPALAVAEQIGIPLPAVPALLAVGALAAQGRISIALVLGTIALAALAADFAWYELGRRRGAWVLAKLRQLSVEPDVCVRRAESIFGRHGARSMLAAKFLPGLTTVMPPLAGVFAVSRVRFALYDLAGVLLWAGTWLALGYFFSDAIVLITARVAALGRLLGLVLVTAVAGYILLKYGLRHLFPPKLGTARVSPEGLALTPRGDERPKRLTLLTAELGGPTRRSLRPDPNSPRPAVRRRQDWRGSARRSRR